MEEKISEILENILSLLNLEGSFEVEEKEEAVFITVEIPEPGILIGRGGETLSALQLLLNLMISRQFPDSEKRIVVDVANWRRGKEEELAHKARNWAQRVLDEGQPMELQPMPAWQRRIVHMTIEGTKGVKSESIGEGPDRHLIISVDEGSKE